jgi:hypothetical protein
VYVYIGLGKLKDLVGQVTRLCFFQGFSHSVSTLYILLQTLRFLHLISSAGIVVLLDQYAQIETTVLKLRRGHGRCYMFCVCSPTWHAMWALQCTPGLFEYNGYWYHLVQEGASSFLT